MLGTAAAAVVATAAYRARTLTKSGALAGFSAGMIAIAAGWSWGLLLFAFFASASVLSKLGEKRKAALLERIIEKGDERDVFQVVANGFVFVTAAAGHFVFGGPHWFALGIGALAASTADTWSTEVGTLGGSAPRLIVSGRRVPPGTSGGLTAAGSVAALAGAICAAAGARISGWPVSFMAVVAGGLAGAFGDSLLGATIQAKRWCESCRSSTERKIHHCGAATEHLAGLAWLDNDGVNFIATMIGGLVTTLFAGFGSGN